MGRFLGVKTRIKRADVKKTSLKSLACVAARERLAVRLGILNFWVQCL